jgi:hypothetical protein
MARASRRRRVELLCLWPEQRDYELIRPLVLFGSPAAERARETGAASERTLQRKTRCFEAEGLESLFGSERSKHIMQPLATRALDLHSAGSPRSRRASQSGAYPQAPLAPLPGTRARRCGHA